MTKPTKWHLRPAKIQISLGIRPVWSESSIIAWRKLGSLATHWALSKDSDQTGRMPRLIWVFAGRTTTLLVLSWGSSLVLVKKFECYIIHLRHPEIMFGNLSSSPMCNHDNSYFINIFQGSTGFPWIDAIMKQLLHEGWIHHVCRHAVSSFLTRGDLWISWEEGLKVSAIMLEMKKKNVETKIISMRVTIESSFSDINVHFLNTWLLLQH